MKYVSLTRNNSVWGEKREVIVFDQSCGSGVHNEIQRFFFFSVLVRMSKSCGILLTDQVTLASVRTCQAPIKHSVYIEYHLSYLLFLIRAIISYN